MHKYFFLLLVLFYACTTPANDQVSGTQESYFDMPALVQEQLEQLISKKAVVIKKKKVNKKTEEMVHDSIDWAKELILFKEANINKPVLKGTYQITKSGNDEETAIAYQTLNEKNKVKKLKVSKQSNMVSAIHIEWEDSNPIYHSEKTLSMTFDNGKLQTYSIHGYQKMIADDTLYYSLDAQVEYP